MRNTYAWALIALVVCVVSFVVSSVLLAIWGKAMFENVIGKPYPEAVQYLRGLPENEPIVVVRQGRLEGLSMRADTVYLIVDSGNIVREVRRRELGTLQHGGIVITYPPVP